MNLLVSPHNDDEALFASFAILAHRPHVVTCLDGSLKRHLAPPEDRVAESAAAMRVLGAAGYEHLGVPLDVDDWALIEELLRDRPEPEHVWAPMWEERGHRHHNRLALLAIKLWPGRVSFYSTYHVDEEDWPHRTELTDVFRIEPEEGWEELKREALDCYQSQLGQEGTRMHFERPLDEWVVPGLRLNLGSGDNPIPGFLNLDKTTGWRFETGLGRYPDGSVEAITESHALMYVNPVHWPFVFSEFARVLVPGGTIRMTHDWIGGPGSSRPVIRPSAAVATTPDRFLEHLAAAGLEGGLVDENETGFTDRTLIQQNYGSAPDVFHVEARKPPVPTGFSVVDPKQDRGRAKVAA